MTTHKQENKRSNDLILKNMNAFIEQEGYKVERLAKKMGKSTSSVYAHLSGKHTKSIYQFAAELAKVLGYSSTYFIDENFTLPEHREIEMGLSGKLAFSAGNLTEEAKEGIKQLGKINDLINIYESRKRV